MRRSVAVITAVASSGAVAAASGVCVATACTADVSGSAGSVGSSGCSGISGISGVSGLALGISGISGVSGISGNLRDVRDVWYLRYLRDHWLTDNWLGDDGSRLSGHIDRRHCRGGRFTQFCRSGGDRQCTRLRCGFRRRLRRVFAVVFAVVFDVALAVAVMSCGDRAVERLVRSPAEAAGGAGVAFGVWRRCRCAGGAGWLSPRLPSCRCLLILLPPVPARRHYADLEHRSCCPRPSTCRNACASITRRLCGPSRLDSPHLLCHSETEQRAESRSSNNTVRMTLRDALCLL